MFSPAPTRPAVLPSAPSQRSPLSVRALRAFPPVAGWEPEMEKTVRELGADDYLSKPPDYDKLVAKINQLVKQPDDGARPLA